MSPKFVSLAQASRASSRTEAFGAFPMFGLEPRGSGGSEGGTDPGSRQGAGSSGEGSDLGCSYDLAWKSGSSRVKWQPSQLRGVSGGQGFEASGGQGFGSSGGKWGSGSSIAASSFLPASTQQGELRSGLQDVASVAKACIGLGNGDEPPTKHARTSV